MSIAESGVSRRRIVQGAAWATPAVLIATASPPAAASQTPGAVSLASSSFVASGVNSVLTLVVTNSGVAGSEPLTGTQVTVTVPASQVTATPVSSSGSGWVLTGPTTSGTSVIYTATYAASIATSTSSSDFVLTLAPAGEDPYPLSAALAASATSNGSTVTGNGTVTRAGTANPVPTAATSTVVAEPSYDRALKLSLPTGIVLTGAKIVATWDISNSSSAKMGITGWTVAGSNNAAGTVRTSSATPNAGTTVSGDIILNFKKPTVGGAYTLVVTGTVSGSATASTRTITGTFA
ncbi:hypothetical protein [Demequina subtropica]|uniref:hypothetical protein n=1 Tax=Demequina subtropica TaxID=1638989 RepID=UPI0012E08452|nr:hypothetical protein [Demequina subtropica]